jgi:channel protein (hemolysin III family)
MAASLPGGQNVTPAELPEQLYHLPGFYEPFSAISHLFGAVVFSVLGVALLRRGRGSGARLAFLGVYACSCVLLFSMSGVYHMMVRGGTAAAVMVRLDYAAIFILIAGSFTPAHGILFTGWLRWLPLLLIWSAAITGLTLKAIFFTDLSEPVGLVLYLVLGWLGIISGGLIAKRRGFFFIRYLLLGGVAYSIGAVMEFAYWPTLIAGVIHPHEVFHLAVLIGAFLHWCFIWQFARFTDPSCRADVATDPQRS